MVAMAEKEQVKQESQPKYRKSAQWFAVGVVILLSLVLMIDTFRRSGPNEKETKPLPIDQQKDSRRSELDFQRRLDQEIKRRQLQAIKPADEQENSSKDAPPRRDLLQGPNALEPGQVKEPSVYEQWKKNEKRRALEARLTGFDIKKLSKAGDAQSLKKVSYRPKTPVKDTNQTLTQEQKRVIAEIERLQKLQQGRGGLPQETAINFDASKQQDAQSDLINVGYPQSEAAPEPGQKLIPTGTVIGAVLDQRLMSDYIGPFRALVTHDVYDVMGRFIIIPKGSRVIGRSLRIANVNEPIQARMGLTVRWLVLPNGKRISFEKRVAALDQAGVPAIKDQVNYHFVAQFLGVAAYAVLASSTSYKGSGYANDSTFEGQLGQSLREQFAPLAAKYLNLVPTITLREGTPLKIFIEDDIYAFAWEPVSKRLFRVNRTSD